MNTLRTATLTALLVTAGCVAGDGADELVDSDTAAIDDDPGGGCWPDCFDPPGPGTTTVTGISLSGREMFDDWRTFGRFALRKDLMGNAGKQHSLGPSDTDPNYLGLRDATVSVYEVDKNFAPTETDCHDQWNVGSATVADDGTWSISLGSLTDGCTTDDDAAGKVKLAVKVRLTFCDSLRCFSVVDPATGSTNAEMNAWSMYESGASFASPWSAGNGASMSFPTHYFRDTPATQDADDIREEAAWAFSALVDETRKFHVQNNWPFAFDDFGKVYVRFPAVDEMGDPAQGNTQDGTTIELGGDGFRGGWVPLHEYGHILHQRITTAPVGTLGNGLTPCGNDFSQSPAVALTSADDCDSWSRTGELEFDEKAWTEGFADFAAHMALDTVTASETPFPVGCSQSSWDVNDSATASIGSNFEAKVSHRRIFGCESGLCSNGKLYPTNIARALCDWYDAGNDDDPQRSGAGDYKSHTLDQMFNTMNGAYDSVNPSQLATDGFTICDFVEFHLIGAPVTEFTSHRDLFQNNGFSCGL